MVRVVIGKDEKGYWDALPHALQRKLLAAEPDRRGEHCEFDLYTLR